MERNCNDTEEFDLRNKKSKEENENHSPISEVHLLYGWTIGGIISMNIRMLLIHGHSCTVNRRWSYLYTR